MRPRCVTAVFEGVRTPATRAVTHGDFCVLVYTRASIGVDHAAGLEDREQEQSSLSQSGGDAESLQLRPRCPRGQRHM